MESREVEIFKRRHLSFLLIGFSLLICIGLCINFDLGRAEPSKTSDLREKVVIAHATPFNSTLVYVAVEMGYFKPELNVSLQGFSSGRDALHQVLNGTADIATVAETPFMYAVMNGAKASIIATISETTNSILIIGRKDKGLRLPGDLKGKKIGVALGTGGEFFLDNVLIFNGIPKPGVKKVDLPPERMLGPLIDGEVDAVVSWEPYAHELLKALGTNGFASYGSSTYNKYTWNLVAQKGWIEKKPETIKKVIQALIQGVAFTRKNPSTAYKIAAGYSKADESGRSRILESTVFKVALHPTLLMSLEDQARWAIRSGSAKKGAVPNFLDYIYFDGLEAVQPEAVTIIH